MDHLVNILVKIFIFLSRFAPFLAKIGFVDYRSFADAEKDGKLHILLVGYSGARNTGSDVRVAETARQLKERLGADHAEISILTLDPESIRSYFDADVHLIQVKSIFLWDVLKACCANQAAILCEGSTFKSKFANALTLYSCEAAGIMKQQHKPCIAYGSEADKMDAFLERTVKQLCSDTYMIARTQNSLDYARSLGLSGHLGTDTAWEFDSSSYDGWAARQLRASGWDGTSPLLGIAPINPFWWPVKPSLFRWIQAKLTGNHSLQFQLWYFFSWSRKRKKQFEDYLDAIASSVNAFVEKHPCHVVILGMEKLDTDACSHLKAKLKMPVSTILSADHDGCRMTAVLRQLSFLVTSRYHAEVLSMASAVPCVAVSMDERLDNLMQEMHMDECQLLHVNDQDLSSELTRALEYVQSHQEQIKEELNRQYVHYQTMSDQMGEFLKKWLLQQYSSRV